MVDTRLFTGLGVHLLHCAAFAIRIDWVGFFGPEHSPVEEILLGHKASWTCVKMEWKVRHQVVLKRIIIENDIHSKPWKVRNFDKPAYIQTTS